MKPTERNRIKAAEAVLFDLDGVLWNSNEAHRQAFLHALTEMNERWTIPKRVFARVAGMTTENAIQHVVSQRSIHWSRERIADFSRRKRRWALRLLPAHARMHPGLRAILQTLSRDHRLALVSAGHPRTIELFLRRSKTRRFFRAVLTSHDAPRSKPSPLIYRAALRKLRVRAADAVAVEDAISGIQSARGAGISVIGMRGTSPTRVLRRAGAFAIISRLSQLCN